MAIQFGPERPVPAQEALRSESGRNPRLGFKRFNHAAMATDAIELMPKIQKEQFKPTSLPTNQTRSGVRSSTRAELMFARTPVQPLRPVGFLYRIRACGNVGIARRSIVPGASGLFFMNRIRACGNVGIALRDFQGRCERVGNRENRGLTSLS